MTAHRGAFEAKRRTLVSATLRVVDDAGTHGVTIRNVAKAAGLSPMSLYTYISTKEELFELAREGVMHELDQEVGELTSWQAAARKVCHHLRDTLMEHPHWVQIIITRDSITLPICEGLVQLLMEAGCSIHQALNIVTRAQVIALGLVLLELGGRESCRNLITGLFGAADACPGDLFTFTVDALVLGLELEPPFRHSPDEAAAVVCATRT